MWNTIARRTARRVVSLAAILALLVSVSLVTGCNKPAEEKPKAAPEKKVDETAPGDEAAAVDEGLSEADQKVIADELAASAQAEITPENAEAIAAELEAEIDADLAEE